MEKIQFIVDGLQFSYELPCESPIYKSLWNIVMKGFACFKLVQKKTEQHQLLLQVDTESNTDDVNKWFLHTHSTSFEQK